MIRNSLNRSEILVNHVRLRRLGENLVLMETGSKKKMAMGTLIRSIAGKVLSIFVQGG
jgi:hypothetical protein